MEHAQFLKEAARHQTEFKEKNIGKDYKIIPNCPNVKYWLTDADGKKGRIYYDGFEIYKYVRKRYPEFYDQRDSNMLRSEHIPFNLFIPLKNNLTFCKQVFNKIVGNIESIDKIEIEYAPPPKSKYLNDRTSFDAYIEYTHSDYSKGIIAIEVKYTEKEYPLNKQSKEAKDINDKESRYYTITESCGIYKSNVIDKLKTDLFRQIWRNHLLAEAVLIEDKDKFKHAHSLIFYPQDNEHFTNTGKEYIEMLVDNRNNKFGLVTYENFIETCKKYCPNDEFKNWIDYLKDRYIPVLHNL